MADVTVEMDEAAIAAMFTVDSPDNPVAEMLRDATNLVAIEAQASAPVSPTGGSKYAPSGFLKFRVHAADDLHNDDAGLLMGLVGTRINIHGGAANYPLPFIYNEAGSTWNRGHRSKRTATQAFLLESLNVLDGWVWGEP